MLIIWGDTMKKVCSAFGHSKLYEDISSRVYEAVEAAVEQGYTEFLTGDMGEFDRVFSGAVRKVKKKHPAIKLICVKPYVTKEMRENKEYYYKEFDEIVIPEICEMSHFKAAITKRNQWMIDNSDLILLYTFKKYGGAHAAKEYAENKNKEIVTIPNNMPNLQKAVILAFDSEFEHWKKGIETMPDSQPSVASMGSVGMVALNEIDNNDIGDLYHEFMKEKFGIEI